LGNNHQLHFNLLFKFKSNFSADKNFLAECPGLSGKPPGGKPFWVRFHFYTYFLTKKETRLFPEKLKKKFLKKKLKIACVMV
jgi:hypothetical protein